MNSQQPGIQIAARIREFRFHQDYGVVFALWEKSGPGIHTGRSDAPDEILKKLQRDPDLFLVAEIEGQVVGTVIGGFDGRRGMIYHLAVDPDFQKQGVGAALMAEVERRLQAKGCLRVHLLVINSNEVARRFYEALGWEKMELSIYGKNIG